MTLRSTASATTVAELRKLAEQGYTRRQAADLLCLSYGHVTHAVRVHCIPFVHGKASSLKPLKYRIGRVKAAGLIDALPSAQRADFKMMWRKGLAPSEAFTALKRPDLARQAEKLEVVK